MNKRQIILILICVAIVRVFLLFPAPIWPVRDFFVGPISRTSDYLIALKNENAVLKSEIASLKSEEQGRALPNSVKALVYSHYPFNIKNQVILNAGANEGISQGMAVAVFSNSSTRGVFVGKVIKADPEISIVQTIFDPEFVLAVRIGDKGTDALLKGGNEPKLTLIPKNVILTPGNIVYNASPDFTYGIPLGTLVGSSPSPDSLFQEAQMDIPYDVNNLRIVGVLGK